MTNFELTNPNEAVAGLTKLSAASEPQTAKGSSGAGAAPPHPRPILLRWSAWPPSAKHARRRRVQRFLAYRRSGRIAAATMICAAIGLPVIVATSPSATAAQLVASAASSTGGSNARSAPAQGGASGTVATVSPSSFTMTTSTGQKVTVEEKSSTT